MLKIKSLAIGALLISFACTGSDQKTSEQKTSDQSDILKRYTVCEFDDGLKITKSEQLPKKEIYSRGVKTADGEKEVSRIDSYDMLLAYPQTDTFANVRPEKSNSDKYTQDKKNVIENLRYLISTGKEIESTEPIKANYNGFEGYGFNRRTLETGNTVGIHTLFNDADQTITTIYFFNANPQKRKFQTLEEWRTLKESFLNKYTRCINRNSNR